MCYGLGGSRRRGLFSFLLGRLARPDQDVVNVYRNQECSSTEISLSRMHKDSLLIVGGVLTEGVISGRRNPLHYGLAERLKKARQQAKKTPNALSVAAGVASGVVSDVEGRNVPRLDTAEKLARALGLSPAWLAYGIEGIGAPPPIEGAPLRCAAMGERLRALRQDRGLSLRALAEEAQLTAGGVGSIETGRTLPSVATAEQLAKALGISPAWLAYDEGPKVLPKPPRQRKPTTPPTERRRRRSAE